MSRAESLALEEPVSSSSYVTNYYRIGRRVIPIDPDEPIRRQMCYRCPSCIQMRNISEYSSERTPLLTGSISLLRSSRSCDKILVYLFILFLVFCTGLGIYSLILESEGAIIEEFDYVSREKWGINSTFLKDIPPLRQPVSKILLLRLTPNCFDETGDCINYETFLDHNKEKIKILSQEVFYNFYQDKNGKIFEGRGWNFQSVCQRMEGCNDILTIGLIEDPNGAPSSTQIKKLKAFLDYSIMDDSLKECYEILVKHSSSRDFDDLAFTLDEMNRKDKTCEYFI